MDLIDCRVRGMEIIASLLKIHIFEALNFFFSKVKAEYKMVISDNNSEYVDSKHQLHTNYTWR